MSIYIYIYIYFYIYIYIYIYIYVYVLYMCICIFKYITGRIRSRRPTFSRLLLLFQRYFFLLFCYMLLYIRISAIGKTKILFCFLGKIETDTNRLFLGGGTRQMPILFCDSNLTARRWLICRYMSAASKE